MADPLKIISDQGLESIRVSFVDQHGILRGKVIVAQDFETVLKQGVRLTSTLLLKDTSHTTVFPVWQNDAGFGRGQMTGASDLLLIPDATTFRVLPWADKTGWVLGDLHTLDGAAQPLSTRHILKTAIDDLASAGFRMLCGLEVEFYVYAVTSANLAHENSGKPQDPPDTRLLSHGYQYLTEQHYDQIEPVMTLIREAASSLDLPVRTMEAEFGPSQFEMTFHPMDPLSTADNMALFRSMVKQVCQRHGYHATFMCKPKLANAMGNGWHLHQSLETLNGGANAFIPDHGQSLSKIGDQWVAGLLAHAGESCLLSTPTVNGYKRYQPFALAPDRIQWGQDNRGAMLRSLCAPESTASRIENRVGEPAANPYLYISSQILSGLSGIAQDLHAPAPVESPYEEPGKQLPGNLSEAISLFSASPLYREKLGAEFVDYYATIKQSEWQRYLQVVSEWEQREYFSLF